MVTFFTGCITRHDFELQECSQMAKNAIIFSLQNTQVACFPNNCQKTFRLTKKWQRKVCNKRNLQILLEFEAFSPEK